MSGCGAVMYPPGFLDCDAQQNKLKASSSRGFPSRFNDPSWLAPEHEGEREVSYNRALNHQDKSVTYVICLNLCTDVCTYPHAFIHA